MYNFINKKLNTKKAFTFAELMISLTVIAIITVILYPTLSDMAPNNNKYLFKSAYRTLETATSDIMNDSELKTMPVDTVVSLCSAFCDRLNTISISPTGGNCSTFTTFQTSNGMRWAFAVKGGTGYVLVDVNAANNAKANGNFPFIRNNSSVVVFNRAGNPWPQDGVVAGNFGVFYTNDPITQDTFLFSIDSAGKITPQGPVAAQHMQTGN